MVGEDPGDGAEPIDVECRATSGPRKVAADRSARRPGWRSGVSGMTQVPVRVKAQGGSPPRQPPGSSARSRRKLGLVAPPVHGHREREAPRPGGPRSSIRVRTLGEVEPRGGPGRGPSGRRRRSRPPAATSIVVSVDAQVGQADGSGVEARRTCVGPHARRPIWGFGRWPTEGSVRLAINRSSYPLAICLC